MILKKKKKKKESIDTYHYQFRNQYSVTTITILYDLTISIVIHM